MHKIIETPQTVRQLLINKDYNSVLAAINRPLMYSWDGFNLGDKFSFVFDEKKYTFECYEREVGGEYSEGVTCYSFGVNNHYYENFSYMKFSVYEYLEEHDGRLNCINYSLCHGT